MDDGPSPNLDDGIDQRELMGDVPPLDFGFILIENVIFGMKFRAKYQSCFINYARLVIKK